MRLCWCIHVNVCIHVCWCIHVKGTITITVAGNDEVAKRLDERNKGVIFKIVHRLLNA